MKNYLKIISNLNQRGGTLTSRQDYKIVPKVVVLAVVRININGKYRFIMKNLFFGLIATITLNCIAFGQTDFDSYGLQHNKVLEVILLKFDKNVNKTNVFDISRSIVIENFPEYKNSKFIQFENYSSPEILLAQISKMGLISTTVHNIILSDIAKLTPFDDYIKVANFVEIAKSSSALKVLNLDEKVLYLNFLSVLKHSSYFWDSKGKNGMYMAVIQPAATASKFSLLKYWLCDAIGGLAGGAGAPIASACYYISEYPW